MTMTQSKGRLLNVEATLTLLEKLGKVPASFKRGDYKTPSDRCRIAVKLCIAHMVEGIANNGRRINLNPVSGFRNYEC